MVRDRAGQPPARADRAGRQRPAGDAGRHCLPWNTTINQQDDPQVYQVELRHGSGKVETFTGSKAAGEVRRVHKEIAFKKEYGLDVEIAIAHALRWSGPALGLAGFGLLGWSAP